MQLVDMNAAELERQDQEYEEWKKDMVQDVVRWREREGVVWGQ